MTTTRTRSCIIIKQNYFRWLYELVSVDAHRLNNNHRELLKILHKTSFYCRLPNDDNRVEDGKKLRETFAEISETDTDDILDCLVGPCSMLEMIIGVAVRMDFQLFDSRKGERTAKWFWELIRNLDLKDYTDQHLSYEANRSQVENILERLLERDYGRNGQGGLFPLRMTHGRDQRNVEIWYQMMAYIDENFVE